MNYAINSQELGLGGINIHSVTAQHNELTHQRFQLQLKALGLSQYVKIIHGNDASRHSVRYHIPPDQSENWTQNYDTTQLYDKLTLEFKNRTDDLEREILLAMLLGPIEFEFPSYDELEAAIRVRKNIVEAARKTALAFHTTEAERPDTPARSPRPNPPAAKSAARPG